MDTIIRLENLGLRFRVYHNKTMSLKEYFAGLARPRTAPPHQDFHALSGIDLAFRRGERVGVIGHNGAGKSTLLKVMSRIYAPTTGRVLVSGRVAPLLELGAGFDLELSGRENIRLNGAILGYSPRVVAAVEPEIIAFTGLEDFIDTPVKYYSSGMYRNLAFAIATAVDPDILLMDEVFAAGDLAFIHKATTRMHDLIGKANLMVFVSHQLDLLAQVCNRVIWLEHGAVMADGAPADVIARYEASRQVAP